jgi:hypothetical protein
MIGFYLGSDEKKKRWECRECKGIWADKSN